MGVLVGNVGGSVGNDVVLVNCLVRCWCLKALRLGCAAFAKICFFLYVIFGYCVWERKLLWIRGYVEYVGGLKSFKGCYEMSWV